MNCYGEICRDLGKAGHHLKEGSTAFGKAAKKQEKPPLFGDKFRRAVIDRGTISKELKKEAKRQFEQSTPKSKPAFQSVAKGSTRYVSPLQKVYQVDQTTSSYQNQPFRKDLPKKPSGRGRGSRYVSTNCTNFHFSQAFLLCTDVGSARSAGGDFAARIYFYLDNPRRGISGDGGSTRVPGSELHKVNGPTFCRRQYQVFQNELGNHNTRSLGPKCGTTRVPGRVGTDSCADKRTNSTTFQQGDESLIDAEVKARLGKCAIQQVSDCPGQFVSPLFLVDKKGGGGGGNVRLSTWRGWTILFNTTIFRWKVWGLSWTL